MHEAGVVNVAAEHGISENGTSKINLETLLTWNPNFTITRDAATKTKILNDPRFAKLAAVQNHRVIVNPRGVYEWCVRCAESALQPVWATETFHPNLLGKVNIRDMVKNFYRDFYSIDLSKHEVTAILHGTPTG
jgi:iron complex transport system substrate-binding protein